MGESVHLQDGTFLCLHCYVNDANLRQQMHMPQQKLMINDYCLNNTIKKLIHGEGVNNETVQENLADFIKQKGFYET